MLKSWLLTLFQVSGMLEYAFGMYEGLYYCLACNKS